MVKEVGGKRPAFRTYLGAALAALMVLLGCGETVPATSSPPDSTLTPVPTSPDLPQSTPARTFLLGLLPIPGDDQTIGEAYAQAAQYADFTPVWGRPTPFFDLAEDLAGGWGDMIVEGVIRGNGLVPLVHLSFIGPGMRLMTPPGMDGATLSDPEWRNAYMQAAMDAVEAAQPPYLSLGNEVNRWFEKYGSGDDDPNGFQHFVSLYEEMYESVKQRSPETTVFCVFAREIVAENREADLSVLSMFDPDRLDILVITSYPHSLRGVNRPADIPEDYYSRLGEFIPHKRLGFSELAWPSLEHFGGEEGQADFLRQVSGRLTRDQGMDLELLGWTWLHDLSPEDQTGLIRRDGTEKAAYGVWKTLTIP